MVNRYLASVDLPVNDAEAFAYHDRPGCLSRLVPPWESVRIESSDGSLEVGSRVVLKTSLFGIPLRWVAEHTGYDPPKSFEDVQQSGPFASWHHQHRFESIDDQSSRLTDEIAFQLPGGGIGNRLGGWKARQTIESMFAYRHRITRDDLTLASRYRMAPQTIAVSGSNGLVGERFCALATLLGHRCRPIVRHPARNEDEIAIWDHPGEAEKLSEVDVVVHLAGKSIADGRWTASSKQAIRDSRVLKTRQLSEAMASCGRKPKLLISASATGFYGDRGEETLSEDSSVGEGFLPDVSQQWEEACQPAVNAGIRVVNPRLGIVLCPRGGALQKMLLPAKLMGGKLGSGQQWWSWIALDDVIGAMFHLMGTPEIEGAVNFTSPSPLRNVDFARVLGKTIGRPALFPAPAFMLRRVLGEMADALLLSSAKVEPKRLLETGYGFRFTDLTEQLRFCLGVERKASEISVPSD